MNPPAGWLARWLPLALLLAVGLLVFQAWAQAGLPLTWLDPRAFCG
ncbi:MAG: hypothetical protein J0H82_32205 [Alphaproteobacteria bacterium]|nr:hypothetical protein [Alphaproteobacteria bacterium]